jgi:hypothetical protein
MQHIGLKRQVPVAPDRIVTELPLRVWHNDFSVSGDGHRMRSFSTQPVCGFIPHEENHEETQ